MAIPVTNIPVLTGEVAVFGKTYYFCLSDSPSDIVAGSCKGGRIVF